MRHPVSTSLVRLRFKADAWAAGVAGIERTFVAQLKPLLDDVLVIACVAAR